MNLLIKKFPNKLQKELKILAILKGVNTYELIIEILWGFINERKNNNSKMGN